jgi:hypothetical protein
MVMILVNRMVIVIIFMGMIMAADVMITRTKEGIPEDKKRKNQKKNPGSRRVGLERGMEVDGELPLPGKPEEEDSPKHQEESIPE